MSRRVFRSILAVQAAGFAAVVALIWLDELVGLPCHLFGRRVQPR
jgi:hypothetical protein